MDMSEIVKNIQEASSSAGGDFFSPGTGTLIVKELVSHEGFKGKSFIASFVVKDSKDIPGETKHANAPGTVAKTIVKFNTMYPKMFWSNIRTILEGIYGEMPEDEELEAAVDLLCQAARGTLVTYSTRQGNTEGSKDMYFPEFRPIAEDKGNTAEEVLARRAEIEGSTVEACLTNYVKAREVVKARVAARKPKPTA